VCVCSVFTICVAYLAHLPYTSTLRSTFENLFANFDTPARHARVEVRDLAHYPRRLPCVCVCVCVRERERERESERERERAREREREREREIEIERERERKILGERENPDLCKKRPKTNQLKSGSLV
jgi:hypothetical protein